MAASPGLAIVGQHGTVLPCGFRSTFPQGLNPFRETGLEDPGLQGAEQSGKHILPRDPIGKRHKLLQRIGVDGSSGRDSRWAARSSQSTQDGNDDDACERMLPVDGPARILQL
jgi:hypothetical protein